MGLAKHLQALVALARYMMSEWSVTWLSRVEHGCKAACVMTGIVILAALWIQGLTAGPIRYLLHRVAVLAAYTLLTSVCGYLLRNANAYESMILLSMEACVLVITHRVSKAHFGRRHHTHHDHQLAEYTPTSPDAHSEASDRCCCTHPVDDLFSSCPNGGATQTLLRMRRWCIATSHAVSHQTKSTFCNPHALVASCMCVSVDIMGDLGRSLFKLVHQAKADYMRYKLLVVALVTVFSAWSYVAVAAANFIVLGGAVVASAIFAFCVVAPVRILATNPLQIPPLSGYLKGVLACCASVLKLLGICLQIGLMLLVVVGMYLLNKIKVLMYYVLMLFMLWMAFGLHFVELAKKKARRLYARKRLEYQAWRQQRAADKRAEEKRRKLGREAPGQHAGVQQDARQQRKAGKKGRQGGRQAQATAQQADPAPAAASPPPPSPSVADANPAGDVNTVQAVQHSGGKKAKPRGAASMPAATASASLASPSSSSAAASASEPSRSVSGEIQHEQPTAGAEQPTDSGLPATAPESSARTPPATMAAAAPAPSAAARGTKGKKQRPQPGRGVSSLPNIVLHPPTPPPQPTSEPTVSPPDEASTGQPGPSSFFQQLGNPLSWVPGPWRRGRSTPAATTSQPSTASAAGPSQIPTTPDAQRADTGGGYSGVQATTPSSTGGAAAAGQPSPGPAARPPAAANVPTSQARQPAASSSQSGRRVTAANPGAGAEVQRRSAPNKAAHAQRAHRPAAEVGEEGGEEEMDEDQLLCVVCMANRRNVGLLHGRSMHLCLCKACSELFREGSACPLCRQPVMDIVDIFM